MGKDWVPVGERVKKRRPGVSRLDAAINERLRDEAQAAMALAGVLTELGQGTGWLKVGELQGLLIVIDWDGKDADPRWVRAAHAQLLRTGPVMAEGIMYSAGPHGRILRALTC